MANILVVDDEKEIADLLELYLTNDGYKVFKFYNGMDALRCLDQTAIDLALLDVMLPDVDGFHICRKIREKYFFPVIMLTARVEDADKIMGLTIGADDYITKPFNPLEVTARVKTQLRRFTRYNPSNGEAAEKHSCEYDLRGLYINKDTHKCKLYEQDLNLTPMEFSILWYLCDHMGKVVSSDELFEAVKKVYDGSPDAISLSTPLQEVENQLNYVKLNVQKNENVAREAEQRKNDLVVYLAHDLKTPLTSVIGYLTLLRDERNISEELQEKYLDISLEKAERLEDLINEFFEIARFNLTTLTLDESSINLTRMLEQVVFEFQPMLNEKNLICHISAPKDLIYRCDANKMQRVFDNLLRNAVNYSFPNSDILIHAEVENDLLRICFQNHGNTISKDKLDRIFEQFFRLDTARASRSGGSGLGLEEYLQSPA